ncbi:MAG: hypothetical protein WAU70_06325, partial [Flavobacteriales bacterium]
AIGGACAGVMYSATAGENWNWKDFGKSVAMGAVAGAIGGVVGQIGAGLGMAQSMGLNIISNSAAQIGTNLAFGNEVTWGMVAGCVIGGVVASGIGGFNGVQGGGFANMAAEVGFNVFKYGVSGAYSGVIGASIDNRDAVQGLVNGAKYGALGGAVTAGLNIVAMGPTYIPKRTYGNFGDYRPVYRTGTFLTRALAGNGTGMAVGRNMITHRLDESREWSRNGVPVDPVAENELLLAHETWHWQQQVDLGWSKFYTRTLWEYIKFGASNTYDTPGTLEWDADQHAPGLILGTP